MAFTRFRIFITLLASFGAFFAYTCRLNLSLTIETMVDSRVETPDNNINQSQDEQGDKRDTSVCSNRLPKTFLTSEEHTFAWLASHHICLNSSRGQEADQYGLLTPQKIPFLSMNTIDFQPHNRNLRGSRAQVSISKGSLPEPSTESSDSPEKQPVKLKWTKEDKYEILGAFFVGYVISQIPSARAAESLGPKPLFLITGFGCGLSSLFFPFAAKAFDSIWPAYIVRFILGCSQGGLFPAAYVLLCNWLPKNERSSWLAVPSAFSRIGTIIMNLTLPYIIRIYGWDAVFYVCGCSILIWSLIFTIFGSSSPSQSYWLSNQELSYIESNMESNTTEPVPATKAKSTSTLALIESKPQLSWMKIIKNPAIYILTVAMLSSEWSNMLLLITLPGFLKSALKMELEEISIWSSVLVAIYCFQYPFSSWCASKLEAIFSKKISSLTVRKMFEVASQSMQAAGCFVIAFCDDKTIVFMSLIVMMLGRSTVGGGQCLMPPELSRDFSGTVFAYANTIANLAGYIGPKTIPYLVENSEIYQSWSPLWILSGCIFITCGVIFLLFADNQPQDYSKRKTVPSYPADYFK